MLMFNHPDLFYIKKKLFKLHLLVKNFHAVGFFVCLKSTELVYLSLCLLQVFSRDGLDWFLIFFKRISFHPSNFQRSSLNLTYESDIFA